MTHAKQLCFFFFQLPRHIFIQTIKNEAFNFSPCPALWIQDLLPWRHGHVEFLYASFSIIWKSMWRRNCNNEAESFWCYIWFLWFWVYVDWYFHETENREKTNIKANISLGKAKKLLTQLFFFLLKTSRRRVLLLQVQQNSYRTNLMTSSLKWV